MTGATSKGTASFDVEAYLNNAGLARKIINYRKGQIIFSQGDRSHSVLYLQQGVVKRTITSLHGKEAVIALLYPGDFFGEGCVAGQRLRITTATAVEPATVLIIGKKEIIRVIHEESQFSDRFVTHMLNRNIRIEEDLTDQLFNSSEKRLARALLSLARYGKAERPKIPQETLAEMIGTTRSRASFFMNKFRMLGYINYRVGQQGLRINSSLLRAVLHEQ